jgi:hypothetical protein
MTKYPYYTIGHLEAGVIKTWKSTGINFPNTGKYESVEKALEVLSKGLKRRKEYYERTGFHCDEELDDQYIILEYQKPFRSRIRIIYEHNIITWI